MSGNSNLIKAFAMLGDALADLGKSVREEKNRKRQSELVSQFGGRRAEVEYGYENQDNQLAKRLSGLNNDLSSILKKTEGENATQLTPVELEKANQIQMSIDQAQSARAQLRFERDTQLVGVRNDLAQALAGLGAKPAELSVALESFPAVGTIENRQFQREQSATAANRSRFADMLKAREEKKELSFEEKERTKKRVQRESDAKASYKKLIPAFEPEQAVISDLRILNEKEIEPVTKKYKATRAYINAVDEIKEIISRNGGIPDFASADGLKLQTLSARTMFATRDAIIGDALQDFEQRLLQPLTGGGLVPGLGSITKEGLLSIIEKGKKDPGSLSEDEKKTISAFAANNIASLSAGARRLAIETQADMGSVGIRFKDNSDDAKLFNRAANADMPDRQESKTPAFDPVTGFNLEARKKLHSYDRATAQKVDELAAALPDMNDSQRARAMKHLSNVAKQYGIGDIGAETGRDRRPFNRRN